MPQEGEITFYSLCDSVGRIRLSDGSELRFGASSLREVVPAVGVRVRVCGVAPHPLGGHKATEVHLAETDAEVYEQRTSGFFESLAHVKQEDEERLEREAQAMSERVRPDPLTEEEAEELARHRKAAEEGQ